MPISQDVKLISDVLRECVCEVLAQNTPQIFLYSMLKLSLFEGLQKRTVCAWPFKCKWAAAEGGVSNQQRFRCWRFIENGWSPLWRLVFALVFMSVCGLFDATNYITW